MMTLLYTHTVELLYPPKTRGWCLTIVACWVLIRTACTVDGVTAARFARAIHTYLFFSPYFSPSCPVLSCARKALNDDGASLVMVRRPGRPAGDEEYYYILLRVYDVDVFGGLRHSRKIAWKAYSYREFYLSPAPPLPPPLPSFRRVFFLSPRLCALVCFRVSGFGGGCFLGFAAC